MLVKSGGHMKARILRSFLAAIFFVSPLLLSSACGNPRIFIENPVFDAGKIPQGEKIAHDFLIKNTGDKVLSVKVRPC